jgi:hypothetical protein
MRISVMNRLILSKVKANDNSVNDRYLLNRWATNKYWLVAKSIIISISFLDYDRIR